MDESDRINTADFENLIYNEDCIQGMRRIPSDVVDLVITDPPFGIEFKAKRPNYNRVADRVLEGYAEVPTGDYFEFSLTWLAEVKRVLRNSGSIFIFSGWNNLRDLLNAVHELELQTVNHIIWKYQFGVATKRKFVTSHYHCLFLAKDDKTRNFYLNSRFDGSEKTEDGKSLRYKDMEDVWTINREYWTGDIKTPTKLPYELVSKILNYASEENDLVMDPFLGSGQVAVVAQMLKRRYLGYEIVPEYFKFASTRLNERRYRISSETSLQNSIFKD